jgi:orotate phosphoribosyltransferase
MKPMRIPSGIIDNGSQMSFQRRKLLQIIKEQSFSTGSEIKLSSGRASNYYFDMKPTMFHPDAVEILANLIFEEIKNLRVDYVGGLEMGAVPLLGTLTMVAKAHGQFIPGFFVRKQPKDHGTQKVIEGIKNLANLTGKRVVILEDVTTTGKSAMKAVDAVRQAGASIVVVLAVVDRCEGAAEFYREQDIFFAALFTAPEFA